MCPATNRLLLVSQLDSLTPTADQKYHNCIRTSVVHCEVQFYGSYSQLSFESQIVRTIVGEKLPDSS